ncbi:MAG: response regulator [Desulfobulbaceae bacterium]|nr:response regulator [Desulfobulbaceae bacterium]
MQNIDSFPTEGGQSAPAMAKVLYVDDEPINLTNFALTFEDDYTVLTAASAEEGLKLFRQTDDISVVVADQRMPGMTGVQMLERIYAMDSNPIRIILTGYTDIDDIVDAINRGHIYEYILKPWRADNLRAALQRAIGKFRLLKENQALSRRLLEVSEAERKSIARDLHDDFGQVLPSLRYSFEKIRASLPEVTPALSEEFNHINRLIEKLGDIGRDAASALRPDMLDRLGLLDTIGWSINDFRRRHPHIQVELEIRGTRKSFSPQAEITLFRLFQEALTNIAKHSRAERVSVLLTFSHPQVFLTIRDNGVGFDADHFLTVRQDGTGVGLKGMRERIATVNGTLTIRSRPGEGTLIRAEVPIS